MRAYILSKSNNLFAGIKLSLSLMKQNKSESEFLELFWFGFIFLMTYFKKSKLYLSLFMQHRNGTGACYTLCCKLNLTAASITVAGTDQVPLEQQERDEDSLQFWS